MSFALVVSLGAIMATAPQPVEFTIFHTNDWQSHLLGSGPNSEYSPESVNDDQTHGGIARLASLLKQLRELAEKRGPVLVIDGGDWTMGTLFHTITRETGAELQLMKRLGYDATVIGNHEFDFRPQGLAEIIQSARKGVGELLPLLSANIVFSQEDPADDELKSLYDEGVIKRYIVVEKGGIKFGIFGLMGIDAVEVSPGMKPVTFDNPIAVSARIVKLLRETEKVDVVIAASHCGISRNNDGQWYGEEVELIQAVPDIDVVVGGHSHTALKKPILENGGVIVQAGALGRYLGELRLKHSSQGIEVLSYQLHPIDDSIPGDSEITAEIERLKTEVTKKVLRKKNYEFDQALVQIDRDLSRSHDDYVLGNIVTDAIRKATDADIAITGNGTIRDDLYKGQSGIQRVSDVFRIAPLGIGVHDEDPGYPLAKVYFTAAELKSILEILNLAYTLKGPNYYPRFSGLKFRYNEYRVRLDRVMDIELGDADKGYFPLDVSDSNARLYSVGVTTYVGSFLGIIGSLSHGVLQVTPKGPDGEPVETIEDAIIDSSPTQSGIQEIKEWHALLDYVKSLPDLDKNGIPDLRSDSAHNELRMIGIRSLSPKALTKNATFLMGITATLCCLGFGILVGLVFLIIRRFRVS